MNRLDGQFAVVTGGTQGLGAAVALRFAEAGAAGIVTCGRTTDKGQHVAEAITRDTQCPVHFVTADLGRVEDCKRVIAHAENTFGTLHHLVNAAAITDRGNILDTSEELFDKMMAVNVRGPYFMIQGAAKLMIRESVHGSITNIGSISALSGQPFISAYCTSKGALATLTRNTAYALMRSRIRVNQLNIGWMSSDGEDRIQREYHNAPENWLEDASANMPFGRLVEPREVARACNFIASDDAGLLTGSVINFDQSVWGASSFAPPAPDEPLTL